MPPSGSNPTPDRPSQPDAPQLRQSDGTSDGSPGTHRSSPPPDGSSDRPNVRSRAWDTLAAHARGIASNSQSIDNLRHEFNLAREHAVFLQETTARESANLRKTATELAARIAELRTILTSLAAAVDDLATRSGEVPAEIAKVNEALGTNGRDSPTPVQ